MKQGHLTLVFCIIYIICFLFLRIEQLQYDNVRQEKQRIEGALTEAVEVAGMKFVSVINDSEEIKRRTLEKAFFEALYVSLGIFEETEMQERLCMYLPMLVLAEEDGVSFYYMEEQKTGSETELSHVWSEKIPYGYATDTSEAEKKNIVAGVLEKIASSIITNHNYIASQYGITYLFYAPDFLQDTSAILEFPMLFAVFQGWPLTVAGDVFYENCLDTGGYLQEVERYIVAGPKSLNDSVCIYHRCDCQYAKPDYCFFYEENVTKEEAIMKYGAVPCGKCMNK